jgi:hypothetical protein
VIVTVTETVDTETLVRAEALTVMVIGLHDDAAAEEVGLDETVLLGDNVLLGDDVLLEDDGGKVLDVVNTCPVTAQEQALEILLGTLEHCETKTGSPVVSVLREVVYVAQNGDTKAADAVN